MKTTTFTRRGVQHGASIALATVLLALSGCSDSTAGVADTTADVASDADDPAGTTTYTLELRPKDGDLIVLDRDLTGRENTAMAFGSTHIAPAVSLAFFDNVSAPRTITYTLDFGIVVPSDERPITVTGPGSYPFNTDVLPGIHVTLTGLEYRSSEPESAGQIVIEQWSTEAGGTVSGTVFGRILQETNQLNKRWIDLDGSFHLTLPARQSGQPGGGDR